MTTLSCRCEPTAPEHHLDSPWEELVEAVMAPRSLSLSLSLYLPLSRSLLSFSLALLFTRSPCPRSTVAKLLLNRVSNGTPLVSTLRALMEKRGPRDPGLQPGSVVIDQPGGTTWRHKPGQRGWVGRCGKDSAEFLFLSTHTYTQIHT